MDAVHLMRAATGRQRIIKVEGTYHGHHDRVQVSVYPDAEDAGPGRPPALGARARRRRPAIARRARPSSCRSATSTPCARVLLEHPGEIAGMIIEPVMMNIGIIPPPDGYLAGARATCCTRTARCSRSTR